MSDAILEAKSRTKKPTKLCLKCGRTRRVDDFYANRDWSDQLGRDIWCKECVNRCVTKEAIKEYCWENHREFTERMWDTAQKRAEKLAANNATYTKANEERRKNLLERLTAQQIPAVMPMYYQYVDNSKDGRSLSYAEAKANGETIEDDSDDSERIYSEDFNGWFTQRDLNYLNRYYKRLDDDFGFDNESIRDYARKVCKSSLVADKAQDLFAQGRVDYSVVKDAMQQFDNLSKSANFAACKRKKDNGSGMTSWSEASLYLQTHGHPYTRKIEWPKDDVDRTILEFHHIVEALHLDGV